LRFWRLSKVSQKYIYHYFAALKATNGEYIINGNYTVSPSGPYEASGTIFDYHRFDGNLKETHHHKRSDGVTEWITSAGPLFEPIHLMVNMFFDIDAFR
jgi:hypothetical protein